MLHSLMMTPTHMIRAPTDTSSLLPIWCTQTSSSRPGQLHLDLEIHNKTATRLPEAMLLQWNPVPASGPQAADDEQWVFQKFGAWQSAAAVVDGGSRHLHSVHEGVGLQTEGDSTPSFVVKPSQSPLFRFGNFTGYPTAVNAAPDVSFGASTVLWDNLWGTNYIMWYPFNRGEASFHTEFDMILSP